ncbi:MAG: hypothetical protein O2856_09090 [Planctomycetota bacterium]|nr:hypothetical protein [Planctomycetota bacterium]
MCDQIRASHFVVATVLGVLLSGCVDDGIGTIYPVKGSVLQNAEPFKVKTGYVLLKPVAEKGNNTKFEPAGTIDADGNYNVYTKQRSGAPPGWYKVIVTASGESPKPSPSQSTTRPLSKSLLPAKYGQEESTPLAIEVVASPSEGAYDLDVTP